MDVKKPGDWLVGIDGGGTKTMAVLCDRTGSVHARVTSGATNPTSVPRGEIFRRLAGILDELFSDIGRRETIGGSCFGGFGGGGIAGNREFMREQLRVLLPAMTVESDSDAVSALTSGIGTGDGIVAIAGTGSGVFARVEGVLRQTGGWGYLLGDEGSGYDLGRRALSAALRAHDGRGEATILTLLCEEQLGEPVARAVSRIYDLGRAFIASFGPVLLEAEARGDPVARKEAEAAALGFCDTIRAAGKWITSPVKQIVQSGSVWQPGAYMETRIKALLGDAFCLIRPELPPVFGSVVEAAALTGISGNAAFKHRFQQSWMEK